MGNEASLEGGEGPPSGLPEGLAPDGKGGFVRVADGTPVNLSELSAEERNQLAAAMSRAQSRQPGGAAAARRQGFLPEYFIFKIHFRRPHRAGDEKCGRNEWRPSESDAQQRSQQVGPSRGPPGLSKSRTVDAFNQGPTGKPTPGRSPSSLSLFESRFRQEPKDPDTKSSGMFGSSFLSGANPLSAVSSMTSSVSSSISSMGDAVNIPKFGLFGDEEEGDAPAAPDSKQRGKPQGRGPQQGPGPKGPQQGGPQKQGQGIPGQGPKAGQGPPGQGPRQSQGPPGQGAKSGQGPPGQGPPGQAPRQGQGPQGQEPSGPGAKQGGPPPQKGGPMQQPGPKQQGPPGPGSRPGEQAKNAGPPGQGSVKLGGGLCPLCKTTQLNTGSKDPPNYNNCTECKNQVCSLCGFSPPDSAGKEWLCLNCQMQRAMGGMDPPGMTKPKQGSAPPSPQRQAPGKPGKLLIKQQSTTDQGLTPPTTPRQKSPGPTSPGPLSPGSSVGGSPKIDPKTGRPIQQKSSPQPSPAKAKQESSFFGGLGGISLGGLTDAPKPPSAASQTAETVTGKLFGGLGGLMESSKPQAQAAPKQEESVAGKLFGGFGGLTESAKPPTTASQMFSFGSSLLSSATNLVSGEEAKAANSPNGSPPDSPADSGPGSPPDSGPGSPPDSPFSPPGSPPDSDSAPDTPPAKSKKPLRTISAKETALAAEPAPALKTKESCPLCNVELNVGLSDTPNYSLCTECKKTVCNQCGFNPTPHLGEKEWLCLNCQTQRAMSGQLGDMPPPAMTSPKKQPAPAPVPSSTPAPAAVDSKPVVKAADLTPPTPETKQQQNSFEKIEEGQPHPETEPSDADDQTLSAPVSEFPAVQQEQSSSEKATGLSLPVESEMQNLFTNTSLHETTVLAEVEIEPNLKITQSDAAAPLTNKVKVELTEGDKNLVETKPALTSAGIEHGLCVWQDPMSDNTGRNATMNENIIESELGKPTEKAQSPAAGQTPSERINIGFNVEQTPITTNLKADSVIPDLKNDNIDKVKTEPEAVLEKPALTEQLPHHPVDIVENASPVAPGNTELTAPDMVNTSPHVAPVEAETKDLAEECMENIMEKVLTEKEMVKQNISEKAGEETIQDTAENKNVKKRVVEKEEKETEGKAIEKAATENKLSNDKAFVEEEIQRKSAVDRAVEVKADDEKAFEAGETAQKTLEKANDQKPLEEGGYIAELSPAPTSSEKGSVCPVTKRKDSESVGEPAPTTTEEIPKDEAQILKEKGKNEPSHFEESFVETVPLLEMSEDKAEKEDNQTPIDKLLKADDNSDKPVVLSAPSPLNCKDQEMVGVKEPVQSVEMVSSSAGIGEIQAKHKVCKEKSFQYEMHVGSLNTNSIIESHEVKREILVLTDSDEKQTGKVAELPIKNNEEKLDEKETESQPVVGKTRETISVSEKSAVCNNDGTARFDVGEKPESEVDEVLETAFEPGGAFASVASAPVTAPKIPVSIIGEQDKCTRDKDTNMGKENEPKAQPLEKPSEDAMTEVETFKTLKEPGEKEITMKGGSPTSPSDLAKLESTVLPILEAQAGTQPNDKEEKLTDTLKTRRKLEVLPLSPDSPSSEDDRELSEKNAKGTAKKKLLVPMDVRADSLDDSSESFGKESPISGDDEEFIRKQIIEMSENEDASPSDEENLVRRKIKDNEKRRTEHKKTEAVDKSTSGKARRLTKKSSISPDDEEDKQLRGSLDKPVTDKDDGPQPKEEEHQCGTAVRKFQTMELNATSTPIRTLNDDGEPEMESLTDSPDDRSRGEGSSSLHASSFTPGTSPTSLSSLDEDSDSSSPSQIHSGEGKQHRKAKHRQPGQTLPTIEDSSEEDELREEEELLREQEKQKGSGKKSKKDKEEIRAQRRREHPKTPPSNLSPIEDASPTEELRQEAEMEEIRRSSCSDFSPSIESDPEGFEIHASKIAAVQKTYQLPMSVSLHSPTEDQNTDTSQKKILKSADEAYEEIMLRAKSPTIDKVEIQPGKQSLYGGIFAEDYAYPSLIDNSTGDLGESDKIIVPAQPKKLRSPDEVYEDMIKKRKEFMQLEQEYQNMQPKKETTKPEIVLQPAETTFSKSSEVTSSEVDKDGRPLLDAETAYEELMKRVLTPGTSPTQHEPEVEATASRRALRPIPDLKVTQCSSGELSSDDESIIKKEDDVTAASDTTLAMETEPVTVCSGDIPLSTSDEQRQTTILVSHADVVDLSSALPKISTAVIGSVSPLPTVPQYTPSIPSVVSTAPPVPPKPSVMRRANSQEKAEVPVAPPLPPPTPPKPTVFPRKPPVPLPPQVTASPVRPETVAMAPSHGPPTRQAVTPTYKPHVPPPVPPKPSIPSGIGDSHRPGQGAKPPIAPKPGSQPSSPAHAPHPPRPTVLPTGSTDIALNLSPSAETKPFQPSPKSPSSPRYASNLRDTYVVITLPSQPSSPVESVSTHAPSSPGPAFPSHQAQPQSYHQSQPPPQLYQQQHTQPTITQSTRVPLAYTRVTESFESQEICGPEKHVSSSCHIIEAVSASAQPPVVLPNLISQVVTTEVQRTTVSVVHERPQPPVPAPRANGVPILMEKPKAQLPAQNGQGFQLSEVVDLRTMKVDPESHMNGVDLTSGPESRHQSFTTDISRQNSAVQSPVVNLSAESSTVSIVTDSITIVTCAATIQRSDSIDITRVSSAPLQLTKNKVFEPVSQIIYRPIDLQPCTHAGTEIPINLSVGSSTGGGTFQTIPVTIAPTVASCVANGLTTGTTTVAGAVDLSTTKPFTTVVSVDAGSAEVVTAVITDDGKPVDLTAGKKAVCCDVVYKLPFAGSCTTQQPTIPLPEDRFGYRDDHYQYDRSHYSVRGFGGIKPSMSDTNLAEAGLFFYKSKNSYNFNGTTEGAVDLTSAKTSDAGEAVDYSKKGTYTEMTIPPYPLTRDTSAVGTLFGTSSVLRSSNGVVYSSVAAPIPSTYAITTQPGSIFSTTYNTLSGMHTSDTMPSLSNLQNLPLTRSHSFLSTISITAKEQGDSPLNLEISRGGTTAADAVSTATTSLSLDTYTDASLEAIAASLEALSSPMVPGDGQYQVERERLEMEKLKQQRLAEELEWERQEIQRFREQEQFLVQKELEELQVMKQQILAQQEEERQAHLMMQKETYAQQQQQLEQIQRLQEQLRIQLEEQKLRQMYPGVDVSGHGIQEAIVLGPDGTVLSRKITESGCQTDEEEETVSKAYTAGRKKKSVKKSVDSCVQTDDEDQEEWEAQTRSRQSRPRTARGERGGQSEISLQAHTEISIQTDTEGNIRMDTRMELSDSERTSPKKRPTPLEIEQSPNLKVDSSTLQAPPKSPKVLYSPISPCISPSKSMEFVSYEKSLGDTSPQKLRGGTDPSKTSPASPRGPKAMQRSMSDPKPMSPTGEERATSGTQYGDSYSGKGSGGTPTGTQKKVKRTLPNPPSEDESTTSGQTQYSTGSARRRMCRNSNMARAKILQDIDRELDLVERESSKLRKRQAELDEEEKEIDAKLRYLEMGINRRKDALLKEREKRERAYLQSVAEDRDYMSDSEVSNIRETRSGLGGGEDEEIESHGLERPRTAPQSELEDFVPPQTKHEYGKYSQYQFPQSQYQQTLYQAPQSYQSHSIYSSVPSLTSSQQQSYHQMLLLQQKAARQAALLSELDATKYDVISRQPDPTSSAYLGVKYDKYGNHLDLRALDVGSIASSPMSAVSDSYYTEVDHHTPRSYMLLEDAAELAKGSTALSSSYSLAERELAKAEKLLRRSAADLGSTDYLGSTSRLHTFGKTPDEEDTMEEPYELKLLKQQLKQEFRRSTGGTENLEQLTGLSQHYYTPSTGISSYSQRQYPKSEKYSISRLTLEKQAAKQLPASMLYQKHKTPLLDPKISSKYSSITDSRGLETDYNTYLGSTSASPRSSRLMQDEITFGLRKNIAEQQKYLGSTLGANLAGSLNLGHSLGLDSAYPSGSRSRPSSRPTSCYGLDLSIKRDPSSSSLRLKGDSEPSGDGPTYQTPSGRTKPTSLPIVQSGRGRIPIVAQNSEEESPLSPVGQPMGMARASAGPLPPISADSRDQFGSCLSLQDSQQQQHIREEPTRGRGYVLLDDLQGTMSDSEAYHLRREETDWFDKPRDGRPENGQEKRQGKGPYYPFPHLRVKLQRDPKDRSVSGNGLGIRVVGGKEVPGSNGDIGAYVAKVLPGGAAEQTGKILEGMQVLEWNSVLLTGKTYEDVQGLVGQPCNEAEVCVRLDLNMLDESEGSQHLDIQGHSKEGTKTLSHPISGEIQLQIHYDKQLGNLIVHVLQARNLAPRDNNGYSDPFVKVYLLPGRGAENKRRSKHAGKSLNPEWNQTVIYKNIHLEQLRKKTLEVSVWDYDKGSSNDFLGEVLIELSNTAQLDNIPRWLPLKEQSEGEHHRRSHSGQSRHSSSKPTSQHSSPKTTGSLHDNQDSPKSSVIKSRSHGIFPDPAKDTQVPTIEKSHSSPGTSKPSPSEGQSQSHSHGHSQHSRLHGASRSSKSAARQHHQDSSTGSGGGTAMATGDASQQSQQQPPQRLQPSQRGHFSLRHQRHSVVGVLTIQRAQSDWLPALPSVVSAKRSRADGRHLTLRKAMSEERPQSTGARSSYRSSDAPVTAASLDSGLSGSAYSLLDEEAETNEVDSAIFQVPRFGKIPNGTDVTKSSMGHSDAEGKSQVMGEIKIALKKEMKTEGEHLVLEILQCRNITYKFKTPDHLPDLYVKLYVVNIATQKRIIKKKTRVCRHDREPSFNETFRFCMNPTGHSLQLFLVSNGGKFVKKTLIGEAYVWLDKVDLRKRVVSWHKLLASTAQIHS
ncbi:Protein piccolo Aczonin Multidomain presynaptic cytomatrix protein [Channa argus]|uniref:Protein piccolo n=1 Tax=Channa argus TaxID=215402 RepID=A0A6G1QRC5_CHAAH|nr:Protein piccolo Aczonin Multidomain presynaptic cytomatrix protein [Channa argus]